jgi:hypothetical protein
MALNQQECVKVMVRIKPPGAYCFYRDTHNCKVLHCRDKLYTFDHVFAAESNDEEVFEKVGIDLVNNALEGYNSTLFVYGQTGTGKTYTMSGSNNREGLLQRSVKLLKQRLLDNDRLENFSLKMSYIEIYN